MDPWRKVTGFKNDNNVVSWKLHGLHKKKKSFDIAFCKDNGHGIQKLYLPIYFKLNKRLGRLENWFHMHTLF
jgi:hypothetical protein